MARITKISEQERIEREAAQRGASRATGFKLMGIRDQGSNKLSNGVTFYWPVDKEAGKSISSWIDENGDEHEIVIYPRHIPEGHFILSINGQELLFEAEEFQRYLRWV